MRSDLHKLFDLGYITVTPSLDLEVSSKLREGWSIGRECYAWHGKRLTHMPVESNLLPDWGFLSWHDENRFKA